MTEPVSPLRIAAWHIRGLADKQSEAARAVFNARTTAGNVAPRVEKSHGTVCDDTAKALKRAEDERIRATRLVQSQSEDLAVKLEHAAEKYDAIDAQEKGNIDRQVQPGG